MENALVSQDYYLILKDSLTAIFTFAGLVIAALGLATWKKRIKGSKEFEAAHNLHLSILKLREAIKHVRSPVIWSGESEQAVKFIKERDPKKSNDYAGKNEKIYIYEIRWQKITDAYIEVGSHLLAAEALWGNEIVDLIKPIDEKVTELRLDLGEYHSPPEMRTKELKEIRKTIYDTSFGTKRDDFSAEVSKYIDAVADCLRKKIK